MSTRTAVVLGVGPGLGMSMAHRLGREGYTVALVSRGDARHTGYVRELAEAGVVAESFVADVHDRAQLLSVLDVVESRLGGIGFLYYGPAALDGPRPVPILETTADQVRESLELVYPAVAAARRVLPGMVERGVGGLLFAGGVSAVRPLPPLGAFAVSAAALRNYTLTLNAALAGTGVYAGNLIIGGFIERGDIHRTVSTLPAEFGEVGTLNPDDIAEGAWSLYTKADRPEAVFSALS